MKQVQVWDLPLRVFHWALVILVTAAIVTAKLGGNAVEWHMTIGVALLGLLVFRLLWGFLGGHHARFSSFIRSPAAVLAYVRGQGQKSLGHNPLGALSVLAILGVLLLQVLTGLFANDDIMVEGPFYAWVSKAASDLLTVIHLKSQYVVFVLIGLHVLAVLYYRVIRRDDIIRPMITGRKKVAVDELPVTVEKGGHWLLGSALLSVSLLASWVLVTVAK